MFSSDLVQRINVLFWHELLISIANFEVFDLAENYQFTSLTDETQNWKIVKIPSNWFCSDCNVIFTYHLRCCIVGGTNPPQSSRACNIHPSTYFWKFVWMFPFAYIFFHTFLCLALFHALFSASFRPYLFPQAYPP